MEQVRHVSLDRWCERIGDERDVMAGAREAEAEFSQAALTYMHTHNVTSYQHAGVELIRVPGEEKLRIRRTTKDEATTSNAAEDAGE